MGADLAKVVVLAAQAIAETKPATLAKIVERYPDVLLETTVDMVSQAEPIIVRAIRAGWLPPLPEAIRPQLLALSADLLLMPALRQENLALVGGLISAGIGHGATSALLWAASAAANAGSIVNHGYGKKGVEASPPALLANLRAMTMLLDAGADPNAADNRGTALSYLVRIPIRDDNLQAVRTVLQAMVRRNVDLDHTPMASRPALAMAIGAKNLPMVLTLIKLGARSDEEVLGERLSEMLTRNQFEPEDIAGVMQEVMQATVQEAVAAARQKALASAATAAGPVAAPRRTALL